MSAHQPRRRGRPPSGGREAILEATVELLRERGIARVTTREIAERAGVSEASVFYHYTDRAGLLQAAFATALAPLFALAGDGFDGGEPIVVLSRAGTAIETFLDRVVPVMAAAQSDTQLRDAVAAYMREHDLGPHHGVRAIAAYLEDQKRAGNVREDADASAAAMLFISSCFMRVFQREATGDDGQLPSLEQTAAALSALLAPPAR
jgi:AcrR family transcriptional regulator